MTHGLYRFGSLLALAWVLVSVGNDARPAEKDDSIEVIANGSGLTAEEALADAFRDAVRQAVGVLVDATTKIKNDELIEDKVLTLSNGFIKSHTKKSERKEKGIIKIRIQAKVERGKLLEKLTEFKITSTEVDGLAEKVKALTRAEIKKQATELIKEALTGLPRALVAEAKKDLSPDGEGQCVVEIQVKADRKRYQTFTATMKKILEAASESRDSVAAEQVVHPDVRAVRIVSFRKQLRDTRVGGLAAADGIVIWMQAPSEAKAATTRWDGYAVRVDSRDVLDAMKGKLLIRVRLLDKDKMTIVEEEFEPEWVAKIRAPIGDRFVDQIDKSAHWLSGMDRNSVQCHLLLAPGIVMRVGSRFFGGPGVGRVGFGLSVVPGEVTYRRRLVISNEELGRVKTVECTPVFKPSK
jgi:hypothetical protein